MDENQECDLRIVRGSQFADAFRRYEILVNGESVGKIARDQTLDIKVPAGRIEIEAKIDWAKSEPLSIETAPDKRSVVEVANNWGPLFALWAITFGQGSYLIVRETEAG